MVWLSTYGCVLGDIIYKCIQKETSQAKSARRGPPEGWECQVYRAYTSIRLVRHILIYIMSEVVGFYVKNL